MNAETPPKHDEKPADSFAMAEYQFLRKEIESAVQEWRLLERGAIAATGIVWSWLATHPSVPFGAWFIPALFGAFGGFRVSALNTSIGVIGEYIATKVEATQIQLGHVIGW